MADAKQTYGRLNGQPGLAHPDPSCRGKTAINHRNCVSENDPCVCVCVPNVLVFACY